MLVLTRKEGESICVGDPENGGIEIFAVRTKEDRVRIGIAAPREVKIHRREIFDLIKKKGKECQLKNES